MAFAVDFRDRGEDHRLACLPGELGDFQVQNGEDQCVYELILGDVLSEASDDLLDACVPFLIRNLDLAAVQLVTVLHVADFDDLGDHELRLDERIFNRSGLGNLRGLLLLLGVLALCITSTRVRLRPSILGLDHGLQHRHDVVARLVELPGHRVVLFKRLGHQVTGFVTSLLVHVLGGVPDISPRVRGVHTDAVSHRELVDFRSSSVHSGHRARGCGMSSRRKAMEAPPIAEKTHRRDARHILKEASSRFVHVLSHPHSRVTHP